MGAASQQPAPKLIRDFSFSRERSSGIANQMVSSHGELSDVIYNTKIIKR